MSAYNYDSYCIKSKGSCGAFTKPSQPVAGLYSVKDLKLSVEDHIKSLNLHTSNITLTFYNEKTLIENQIGSLLNSDGVICAKHQYLLGIYWKWSSTCQYPNHKKGKWFTVRTAGYELSQHIPKKCNIVFHIGSNIYTTNRKQEPD